MLNDHLKTLHKRTISDLGLLVVATIRDWVILDLMEEIEKLRAKASTLKEIKITCPSSLPVFVVGNLGSYLKSELRVGNTSFI